jgi:hypothetical protein
MVGQSDESDNNMPSPLKNDRCKRPGSGTDQSGHARAHKKVCYEADSNGKESDADSSDDGIERGASPSSPALPAAPCNDSGPPFNAVLTKGTTLQALANGSNSAEKRWSSEDPTLPFTARLVEAHLCTKVAKSVPMHEGEDSFDGFGTGLVVRKALRDCVAPAVAKAVLEKARLEQTDPAQANDADICGGDGRTEATYNMLRAFQLARGGDPNRVDAASEEELRNSLEFIPRTAVDELANNELYKVSVAYPATLHDASIVDGSTAKMVLPQLKCEGESGNHRKVTTTTFFRNKLVAPGGHLYAPNPHCDEEAKLDICVRWHTIEGRPLALFIEGGKAELKDGDKVVSTVFGVDMSFARMSEYKEADVRHLQKRFTPERCFSLEDQQVLIAAVNPSNHIAVAAAIAACFYPKLLCITDEYCDKEPELRVCEPLSSVWRSAPPHTQTFMEDAVDIIGGRMASLPDSPRWNALGNAYLDTSTGSKLIPESVTYELFSGEKGRIYSMASRRQKALKELQIMCTAKSGDGSPALKEKVAFKCSEWKNKLADLILEQVCR